MGNLHNRCHESKMRVHTKISLKTHSVTADPSLSTTFHYSSLLMFAYHHLLPFSLWTLLLPLQLWTNNNHQATLHVVSIHKNQQTQTPLFIPFIPHTRELVSIHKNLQTQTPLLITCYPNHNTSANRSFDSQTNGAALKTNNALNRLRPDWLHQASQKHWAHMHYNAS